MHNRDSKINCDFAYCLSLLKPKEMTALNQSHQVLVIMNAQSLFVSKDLCARVVNSWLWSSAGYTGGVGSRGSMASILTFISLI